MKTTNKKRKKKASRQSTQPKKELHAISPNDSASKKIDKGLKKKDVRPEKTKKKADKMPAEKGGLLKYANIISQFLRECKVELKKVKWPTRKELVAATAMVVILALIIGFYLGVIDLIYVKIIKWVVG